MMGDAMTNLLMGGSGVGHRCKLAVDAKHTRVVHHFFMLHGFFPIDNITTFPNRWVCKPLC
jgi:hypothetical protein